MGYLTGCMKVLWYSVFTCRMIIFILEEVLATNYAMWWAPDGEHLLYAAFNDSVVRDFNFPFYGDYNKIYTDIVSIAYPKVMCNNLYNVGQWNCFTCIEQAGTANPVVSLVISDLSNDKVVLDIPSDIVGV